jgi:hypothetical protein
MKIWDTKVGFKLIFEHKIHRDSVNAVDWNIHDSFQIYSVGSDKTLIGKQFKQNENSKL